MNGTLDSHETVFSGCHDCPCCSDITYADTLLCSECIEADCQPNSHGKYSDCAQAPTVTYETIISLHGDEAETPLDLLYSWQGDQWHVHYLGATSEGIDAAFSYLRQWDYGDPGEEHDDHSGKGADFWIMGDGEYVLSAHLGLSWITLERIVVAS